MTWVLITLGYLLALIAAILLYNARRIGPRAIRFGGAHPQTKSERAILIDVYRAQQKQAFKLILITVAAGVLLPRDVAPLVKEAAETWPA